MRYNGRMTDKPHALFQCQPCQVAPGYERHPEAMKRKMSKSKRTKKERPTLAGTFWQNESNLTPDGFKALDQWNKFVSERKLRNRALVSLSPEPDNPPVKVNVRKRNLCLGKPAPLMPGNKVTDPHPLRAIQECRHNLVMFLLRNTWPASGRIFTNAEFRAWVDFAIAKLDRLEHDKLENSQVPKRRVFASATPLPPRQKPVDMGACQLPGVPDTGTAKVKVKRVPAGKVAGERVEPIRVTGPEIPDYPRPKIFEIATSLYILGLKVREQFTGATRLYRVVMSKLRGLKTAFAGFRVKKRNPVKRATCSCVK